MWSSPTALWTSRYMVLSLSDTRAQRGKVTCPRSHSWYVVDWEFESRLSSSHDHKLLILYHWIIPQLFPGCPSASRLDWKPKGRDFSTLVDAPQCSAQGRKAQYNICVWLPTVMEFEALEYKCVWMRLRIEKKISIWGLTIYSQNALSVGAHLSEISQRHLSSLIKIQITSSPEASLIIPSPSSSLEGTTILPSNSTDSLYLLLNS